MISQINLTPTCKIHHLGRSRRLAFFRVECKVSKLHKLLGKDIQTLVTVCHCLLQTDVCVFLLFLQKKKIFKVRKWFYRRSFGQEDFQIAVVKYLDATYATLVTPKILPVSSMCCPRSVAKKCYSVRNKQWAIQRV